VADGSVQVTAIACGQCVADGDMQMMAMCNVQATAAVMMGYVDFRRV